MRERKAPRKRPVLSLPRFTVRRMMIAVAIVGFLMGSGRWVVEMRVRSADYRKRAYDLAETSGHGWSLDFHLTAKDGRTVSIREDEDFWLEHAWARKLADKYWHLAIRPWLPAEPDSPRPEPLAHGRSAVDCPAELALSGPPCGWCASCRWYAEPIYPWWSFLWTWRNQQMPNTNPRWSFS